MKLLKRFFMLVFVLAFLAVAALAGGYYYIKTPVEHPEAEVTIEPGSSVIKITKTLEEAGVIKCTDCFRAYVGVMGLSSKLRAGDFTFPPNITPQQVVRMLLKGDFKTYKFTIPEGWTAVQIASYLQTLPFVKVDGFAEKFLALTKDQQFIDSLEFGWSVSGLEGYLFPNTYEVYKVKEVSKIATVMADEFKKKFSDVILKDSGSLNLTPKQIVVLASIVEKETANSDEKPLVASVFFNRLKKGMFLQSDPTVIYGLKDYDGNITKRDLQNGHPYNTYVHAGLPAGPICNPGQEAIEAVLHPAETEYYYFVSKNDGRHQFSKNYDEHQKAVYKYQILREE